MPVRKKDAQRALLLLEDYRAKLHNAEDRQLRGSIQRVIDIFQSNLFQALIDIQEFYEVTLLDQSQRWGESSKPADPMAPVQLWDFSSLQSPTTASETLPSLSTSIEKLPSHPFLSGPFVNAASSFIPPCVPLEDDRVTDSPLLNEILLTLAQNKRPPGPDGHTEGTQRHVEELVMRSGVMGHRASSIWVHVEELVMRSGVMGHRASSIWVHVVGLSSTAPVRAPPQREEAALHR
ncbi:hypothetical protein NQZ68_019399 [Dissostichus eleginoides]|nr:hypothetical protein NQZ68_019399 [Dissostichus eleginoides]